MGVSSNRAQRFSTMYGALYGRIHAYGARRVGRDAADEIAAEVFTVAWHRFDELAAEPLPWLYGVARNVVLRHRVRVAHQTMASESLRRERAPTEDPETGAFGIAAA
jgi:DNA-directed RNA polymerase specialized sigma24 family protein